MRRRTLLLGFLLFAVLALHAKSKLQITIELDQSLPEKERTIWLGYLLARANYVSEHEKEYDTRPGPIVPKFAEELSARRDATQIYRELKVADPALIVSYFDDLGRVDDAQFLAEYVWTYLRHETWKAPDGARLKEFEEWRMTNLVDHQAQTRGRLAIGEPEGKDESNARAESVTASISFPQEIGELKFQELHQPTKDDSSTRVHYGAPGMTFTLIIYGGGSDLPDGIESKRFKSAYESSKSALRKSGGWDKVKLLDERTVEMGSTHIQAREASFKVTKNGVMNLSYLCLSASNHAFFKIRLTVSGDLSDSAQTHLPLIRSAVGQVISDFKASSKGAT